MKSFVSDILSRTGDCNFFSNGEVRASDACVQPRVLAVTRRDHSNVLRSHGRGAAVLFVSGSTTAFPRTVTSAPAA